ncbi:hypothetical protein [Streptomyces massasporeus]|uniref:hypothetical protein n=1 Tax=Streptomyces massasporeus TaxID=67324 RepID=UPI0037F1B5AA
MDQGDATFWAAVIGVGGALIGVAGGAFTGAWAARIGAREQALVNFHEWLRQQQRAAYAEMHTVATETVRLGHVVARLGSSHRASLDESLYKLVRAESTVGMVGPPSLEQLAQDIINAAFRLPISNGAADWDSWAINVSNVLVVFKDEASKVVSTPPALK